MKKESNTGVYYITLMDDTNSKDFEDLIERAISAYQPFNFQSKIEVIVFFDERAAFSEYVGNAYGIQDEYTSMGRAIHYPYGLKSVIGVHAEKGLTEGLLTHELGHAIEHYKLKLDLQRYEEWKQRRGYLMWSEFFCQAHASYQRRELPEENDIYAQTFIVHLEDKAERFNETNRKETFLYLIYSMSDLYYYAMQNNQEALSNCLGGYHKFSNNEFIARYIELFQELINYLLTNGTNYNATHDYAFFERLELHEKELMATLNEDIVSEP